MPVPTASQRRRLRGQSGAAALKSELRLVGATPLRGDPRLRLLEQSVHLREQGTR